MYEDSAIKNLLRFFLRFCDGTIPKGSSMSFCLENKSQGQSICNTVLFYYLLLLQLYFFVFECLFRIFLYFRLIALKEAQVTYTKKKLLIQNHLRLCLQSQN